VIETDPHKSGDAVEDRYCELAHQVRASLQIPVSVKLSPFFSSMVHMARRLDSAGADALVLFNRFYQADFDIENLEPAAPSPERSLRAQIAPELGRDFSTFRPAQPGDHRRRSSRSGGCEVHDGRAEVSLMTSALRQNGVVTRSAFWTISSAG
jgi:hypothetical protein